LKITWASNAPWAPTGYGTQTKQVLKRLKADGHEVAVAANFGLMAQPIIDPDLGIPIVPLGADGFGNDVLLPHHRLFGGDWIITLYDVWVYQNPDLDQARIASWTPVDHAPVPPKVADWASKHPTIAMSRFGEAELKKKGIAPMYAPHALELDTWKQDTHLPDGKTVRESLGIPEDAFLVMINAANKGNVPPRKAWNEMLYALAILMRDHDDVWVYIHSELRGVYGGVDLIYLMMLMGIPAERVRYPDQYAVITGLIDQDVLSAHYASADVLLATSMGEGFGLTVLEAQACGTPVIVTNFSAQPELVGGGWTVGFQPFYDHTQGSWFAIPLIEQIYKALNEARERKGDPELRTNALAKAAEYHADKVYVEYWRPIIETLDGMMKPVPRAIRRQNARAKKRAA
jgi:glycosyltransferase involved in cell wall biosynthesis